MKRSGVLVFGYVLGFSILVGDAFAANERRYYDALFADGRFEVTVALGFEQSKQSVNVPVIGPVLEGVGNFFRAFERDEESTMHDVDAVEGAILGCVECGFQVESRGKGERVYRSSFHDRGREIVTRVRFIFTVAGVETPALRRAFISALGSDDTIIYIGHARGGRGFPDFGAPTGDAGKVFVDDEFLGWSGFDKGYFARDKYQILSIDACKTHEYFTAPIRARVWEKDPASLALLMTSDDSWFEDYPGTTVALIRGLMLRQPRDELLQAMESAAGYYQAKHAMDEHKKALFVADGFFDESYEGKSPPKRQMPKEPWRSMPF